MEQRNFLVYVRIAEHPNEGTRLRDAFRFVVKRIESLSDNDFISFPVKPGDRCAVLLCRCAHDARWIVGDILYPEKHDTARRRSPDVDPMHSDDLVSVIEVSSDFSAVGAGNVVAWLQRRSRP